MGNLNYSGVASSYKGKNVLVTGHTGFKGGWLSLWLSELGANVIGYSLPPTTTPNLFDAVKLGKYITHTEGDINLFKSLKNVFTQHRPDIVFHLAAQPIVRKSYKDPRETFETNVLGTLNVLEEIRATDSVKTAVIVTSDKCYKNKEWEFAYRENDELGGLDPYSASKSCAEILTAAYRESFFNPNDYGTTHNTIITTVRAGNVVGGGDWGEYRLVPDCVRNLHENHSIEIRNPAAVRPWQYVLDPLYGYLLLGANIIEQGYQHGNEWNFGPDDNNCINVESLVMKLIKSWGKGDYNIQNKFEFRETKLLRLNSNKARKLLGWHPKFDIVEAIDRTINWYKLYYLNNKNNISELDSILREYMINEIQDYEKRLKNQ